MPEPQDVEPGFTSLVDLAAERVGGIAVAANDEFFAEKENLLKPGRGVFIEDKFTDRGKWMDGWETRRRREPGNDWCVVKLAVPGVINGIEVDTNHFTGNYPEKCSVEGAVITGPVEDWDAQVWEPVVRLSPLRGSHRNKFAVSDPRTYTHVRLSIFPDGGVARMRVYGEAMPDWAALQTRGQPIDVASVLNGARVLDVSDTHYGLPHKMLLPDKAINMGDGWETRRRRGPGNDWAIIKLGLPSVLDGLIIDTTHFKGNYPDTASVEGTYVPDDASATGSAHWGVILDRTKLEADTVHQFREILERGPFSHLRINIFPDGGVARFRAVGKPAVWAMQERPA